MMHENMGGWGFGHWGVSLLFWLVVILAIVALVKYLSGTRKD